MLPATALTAVVRDGSDSPSDCRITAGSFKYDLTGLAGEHTVSRKRDTPPSTMEDSVRFDLCGELVLQDGVAEKDQVCLLLQLVFFPLTLHLFWILNSAIQGRERA